MNVTIISGEIFVQTLSESNVLTTLQGPGAGQTYVCERHGENILIVTDATLDDVLVIHPCAGDREAGGSIHDHARDSVA